MFGADGDGHAHQPFNEFFPINAVAALAYALTDSPIGQAAWFYEKYEQWTDHDGDPESLLTRDEMLDNITFYWLTATAASSARIYWQSMRSFKEHPISVPGRTGHHPIP